MSRPSFKALITGIQGAISIVCLFQLGLIYCNTQTGKLEVSANDSVFISFALITLIGVPLRVRPVYLLLILGHILWAVRDTCGDPTGHIHWTQALGETLAPVWTALLISCAGRELVHKKLTMRVTQ